MSILEEIEHKNHSIVITLPSSETWENYEKELAKVKNYNNVMNFKVHNFPKGINKGDKCYIVHKGFIKDGWKLLDFLKKSLNVQLLVKCGKENLLNAVVRFTILLIKSL